MALDRQLLAIDQHVIEAKPVNHFDALPYELVFQILNELSIHQLCEVKAVSKRFNLATNALMYRKIMEIQFPHHYIPLSLDQTFDYEEQVERAFKEDYRSTVRLNFLNEIKKQFTPTQIAIFQACKMGNFKLFLQHFLPLAQNEEELTNLIALNDQTGRNFFQWAGYFCSSNILDVTFSVLSIPFINHDGSHDFESKHYGIHFRTLIVLCNQIHLVHELSNDQLHPLDNDMSSAVEIATACSHVDLVNYLINERKMAAGGPATEIDPLCLAAQCGNKEMVAFWITKPCEDINQLLQIMRFAVIGNNAVSMSHLLNISFDVNATTKQYTMKVGNVLISQNHPIIMNPMKSAVHHNKIKLALMMLKTENCKGHSLLSEVLYENIYRFTPVLNQKLADSIFDSVRKFYLMSNNQYDLKKVDEYGNTFIHWIAFCNQLNVLSSLNIPDPSMFVEANHKKQTPADLAAICNHTPIIQYFIKSGLNVNIPGPYYNETLLHHASAQGHVNLVQYLLTREGINVNLPNGHHSSPLRSACEEGHYEIAVMLVNSGANYNMSNLLDSTPLISAAKKGHAQIVRFLLTLPDIDIDARSPNNCTALDWATLGKHNECIELLSSRRSNHCNIM